MTTNNILKKFLQLIVATVVTGITVFFFGILAFRIDLILELLNSKTFVAILSLIIGATTGFIVGCIVCFLKLSVQIEAKDKKNAELEKQNADLSKDYEAACKHLGTIYGNRNRRNNQKRSNTTRANEMFGQITDFPIEDEETTSAEENVGEEEENILQEEPSSDES